MLVAATCIAECGWVAATAGFGSLVAIVLVAWAAAVVCWGR